MATRKSSARSSPETTPDNLDELVSACLVLDDWLQWMVDACGSVSGGVVLSNASFCSPYHFFREYVGDETTVFFGVRYLLGLRETMLPEFSTGIKVFKRDRSLFPLPNPLLIWRSGARNLSKNYGICPQVFLDQIERSYPTAHLAAYDHFDRLGQFVEKIVTPHATDFAQQLEVVSEMFSGFEWNQAEASRLLAGMEQERRWLFLSQMQNQFPAGYRSGDDYIRTWRPYGDASISLSDRVKQLSRLETAILLTLLQKEPQTQRGLIETTKDPKVAIHATRHSTLIREIKSLIRQNMIYGGARGRASAGYCLTPFGRAVAMVICEPESNRPALPRNRNSIVECERFMQAIEAAETRPGIDDEKNSPDLA